MAFQLTYRLEFKNFEENIIRIDIATGTIPMTPGATLSVPANVAFNHGPPNKITILSYPVAFFYIGMTFTVTGSVSNNGTFTVIAINDLSVSVEVTIAETLVDEYVGVGPVVFTDISTTTPQIITLIGTGTPLVISTINNDQDKFQPIRSKQAVIQFISQSTLGLDISTFSTGADNRWYVEITIIGGDTIFLGFLIMSDNQQPFQPDPQTVQLTATDHLGALKDVDLVDLNGINPLGKYRIADLLTMALKQTGLSLDLFVVNNLRTGSGQFDILAIFTLTDSLIILPAGTLFFYPGQEFTITGTASNDGTYHVKGVGQGILTIVQVYENLADESAVTATFTDSTASAHMYDVTYLDAKTFEKEIGTCINAYDALARILGEDCWIGQYKGAWWIMRVDEFDNNLIYVAHFLVSGQFSSIAAGTTYNKSIGFIEDEKFARADTLLQFIRPHGYVRDQYNFKLPLEIICNIDFSRGAITTTVSDGEKHFDLDCWAKLWSNTTTDDPATAPIYIRRDYINDTEVKRYVVIERDPTGHLNFIESERIAVNLQDKFIIDFSVRTSSNIGGSGSYTINAIQVRLYGDDGTYWTAHGKKDPSDLVPTWVESDITFRTSLGYFYMQGDLSTTNFTESQSLFSGEAAEIPVSGYLVVLIFANPEDVTARDTYIDKLTFDYIPLINGSYQKYSGDFNRVDRAASGYMAKRDNEVFMYDSPVKLFKGAMLLLQDAPEVLILTALTDFSAVDSSFTVPGDQTGIFIPFSIIRIAGTASNNGIFELQFVTYDSGTNTTKVIVFGTFVDESAVTASFFETNEDEGIFILTARWYSAAPLALALNTDPALLHSYGYIQAYSIWNQFRGTDDAKGNGAGVNIFTGSVLGLSTDWPDLIHKYLLTDINAQTNDRYFVLISMSQDWKSCIWTATLVECFNTVAGRNYDDPESFGYISE